MPLPERKQNRLKDFNYSANGAYFVTICVNDRKNVLWKETETDSTGGALSLFDSGLIVDKAISNIPKIYPNVQIGNYTVMPNHIHIILMLYDNADRNAPTVSRIIQQLKRIVTKQIGISIWQKSFYDHIIRNEQEYLEIWEYIDNNPLMWQEDCYYQSN